MNRGQAAASKAAFAERFNQALDALGFPSKGQGRQAACAAFFHRSGRAVQRWLVGTGLPQRNEYDEIARRLQVRMPWLFFGLGPMHEPSAQSADQALLEAIIEAVDQALTDTHQDIPARTRARLVALLFEALRHK